MAAAAPAVAAPVAPPLTAAPRPRERVVPAPRPVARKQKTRQGAGLWIGAGLLALLAFVAVAAFLLLPPLLTEAQVVVTPGEQTITREVLVPVSTGGAATLSQGGMVAVTPLTTTGALTSALPSGPLPAPPVAAQPYAATLSVEGDLVTTGVREQPAGTDKITLALINPNRAVATLGAGTEVEGNGVTFRLTRDATVAAAVDTGTSLVYSQGSVEAEATAPGPHDVGRGAVAGVFNNGVRFSNTTAATGGYMERIATVTQEDMDKLKAQLVAQLQPQVNGKILAEVPQDMQPIMSTLSVPDANWSAEPNHVVGEDATELHMKMTVSGSIMAFKPADVSHAVETAVMASVQSSGRGEPKLEAGSIQQGPLEMAGNPAEGQVTYRTTVTSTVQYQITPDMEAEIKEMVRGQPVDTARELVLATFRPYVADVQISAGMLNFNQDKVPNDVARIRLDADDAQP
jgi:hypothetical protein